MAATGRRGPHRGSAKEQEGDDDGGDYDDDAEREKGHVDDMWFYTAGHHGSEAGGRGYG